MTKVLSTALGGVIGIFDRRLGAQVSGIALTAAGIITGNALLVGLGSFQLSQGFAPRLPKPDTVESAIKTERPPRVSGYGERRLYGAYACYETATNGTAVDVFAFHDGPIEAITGYYLNDDPVTIDGGGVVQDLYDERYGKGIVSIYTTLGQTPGSPFSAIIGLLPGKWTSDHRGDGVVMGAMTAKAVSSENYLKSYPNGVPTLSIVARLQRCPDFNTANPADESTWTWTENAVRHLAHYALVREGLDYDTKFAPTLQFWRAAQNVCDEVVPLKAGGSEARYRSCITHKHTDSHASVKGALLTAFDGWLAPRADGALVVHAGRLYTPSVGIGPADIVGFEWNGVGVDDDKAVNEIACAYVSADHDYSTVDTDAWTDEADISTRGQVLASNLDPQVPSHGQVRRLAKRQMIRTNAKRRGTVTTNPGGRKVRGERFIALRIEEAGAVWFDGVAEIVGLTRNLSSGGVTFEWVEVDAAIDQWVPAIEEGEPAPLGDRVAPEPLEPPVIAAAAIELDESGANARVRAIVSAPPRDDRTWYLRWRVTSDSAWNVQSLPDAAGTVLTTALLPVNVSVDIQAAYTIGDGRLSPWSATTMVSTSTADLPPRPVTNVSAAGGDGQISVAWRNPGTSNFGFARVYVGNSDSFGDAAALFPADAQGTLAYRSVTFTGIEPGEYHVWVQAFSANSIAAAPVEAPSVATVTAVTGPDPIS